MKERLLLLAALLTAGCASTDSWVYDSTPRAPVDSVWVIENGAKPDRPYKLITTRTYLAARQDELKVKKRFVTQACAQGADGMFFSYSYAGDYGGWAAVNRNGV